MERTSRILRRAGASALALALAASLSSHASADPHSGVDALLYRPSLDTNGVISLESARGLHQYDFGLKVNVGFAQNPLKLDVPGIGNPDGNTDTDSVLEFALNMNMTAAFAFTNRLSFGMDVSLLRTNPDDGYGERGTYRDNIQGGPDPSSGLISLRPISNIDPSGGFEAQGHRLPRDLRVGFKYVLTTGKISTAVLAIASVPFGDEEMFLGDQSFVLEPRLAVDYALDAHSRIVANVAARFRKRTVLEAFSADDGQMETDAQAIMDVGSEAVVGLGLLYELAPQLIVAAEGSVFVPLPSSASWGSCRLNNLEKCDTLEDSDYFGDGKYGDLAALAMLGINYRATPDSTLTLGGGTAGLIGDGRGEDFRFMAGVIWQPSPAGERTIGKGDQDGDGVPDRIDICPDEPEDGDGYQDDDGCPDLDNDGDGVIDAKDACPDEPEDRDGYRDDDGCPERDNDEDGVPDVTDRCPNDKEDIDRYEDDDGCPDEDNDGDGIQDTKDQCPNEAETVNGFQDTDGCPDARASGQPQMDPDRIDLQGAQIKFSSSRSSRLNKTSEALLDDVAELLNNDTNSRVRIRIEVHVPLSTSSSSRSRINRAKRSDKDLARKRADAIRDYLIRKGKVDGARLQAAGLGSDLPIRQPATDDANERVDFIRTEQQ